MSGSTEGTSQGCRRHPWDVPSVDPSTLGQKTLYELASLKYCYNSETASSNIRDGRQKKCENIQQTHSHGGADAEARVGAEAVYGASPTAHVSPFTNAGGGGGGGGAVGD